VYKVNVTKSKLGTYSAYDERQRGRWDRIAERGSARDGACTICYLGPRIRMAFGSDGLYLE
jgi:hypothetical protein